MNTQFFARKKESGPKPETNKEIARNANRIALLFGIIASVISFAALIVAAISLSTQKEDSFSEQIFQPLVYTYSFDANGDIVHEFEGFTAPEMLCRMKIQSGFPTRVAVINSDVQIENMYGYSSKIGVDAQL